MTQEKREPFARQVKREFEILKLSLGNGTMKKRSIPLSLFRKLLSASKFALENGFVFENENE